MAHLACMEITDRFGKVWHEWDARVAAGESPQSILAAATDEQLLYLLGSESKGDRKYARDIIVTALLNRRHRQMRDTSHDAARVLRTADAASQAARTGQAAIHEAEALLREHGQDVRGTALSDSAFSSLAATKAAFESARAQAERFRDTLLESEAGAKLADAAAKASHSADEAAEGLEERMAGFGRGPEGRAATDALRSISRKSDDAAVAAGERARGLQEKADEAQRKLDKEKKRPAD